VLERTAEGSKVACIRYQELGDLAAAMASEVGDDSEAPKKGRADAH